MRGDDGAGRAFARSDPAPAPEVVLTDEERQVWARMPADRSEVPVLLYHGVAPAEDFANESDAAYGLDPEDFAKQMKLLHHAGYRTITLGKFVRFVRGEQVDLPRRPLLLTFDDARADSWIGGDGILRELGFCAVIFVDVGRVARGDPEYLTDGWRERTFSDLTWGAVELAAKVPGVRPLAFSPPYGSYGQDGTNDSHIPEELLAWLTERYAAIFTQDVSPFAAPGDESPLGRLQVTRGLSGGDLHAQLAAEP